MKNIHQRILQPGTIEFFAESGMAYAFIDGEKIPLKDWPCSVVELIMQDIDRHPGAESALERMGLTEPIDKVNQYTMCMYGDLNLQPDFINNRSTSDAEFCQLMCGAQECKFRGVLCRLIHADYGDLTERETDICRLMMQDLTGQEIADQLGISLNTFNTHVTNILPKIGVKNSRGIAVWAVHHLSNK